VFVVRLFVIKQTMESLTPNQALERTAARRMFTFQMTKTVLVEAILSLGGGRSAWSR
jgi:hypothetical protein